MHIVPLKSLLEELRVAALGRHLRQVVRPAWLVTLVVPIVEHVHGCIAVLHALLKQDLRKHG